MMVKEQIKSEYGPAQVGRGQIEARDIQSRVHSAVHARQGVVSGRVVTVLGVSVALAILGMILAFVLA